MDGKELVKASKRLREVQSLLEGTKDIAKYKTLGRRNNDTITLSIQGSMSIICSDRGSLLCKDIFKALEKEEKRVNIRIRELAMKE
jgi:hypothetical protein